MRKSVCLDAGHYDTAGAHGHGIDEASWALAFALKVAHYVRAAGSFAVLTRKTERNVDLRMRGRIAKAAGCSAFLSIHLNAAGKSSAHGCEAFVAPGDERSAKLAMRLLGAITTTLGLKSRGVKPDNQSQHRSLTVLRTTYKAMPAVLVEIGFVSNPDDAEKLKDRRAIENLAVAMARELLR